MNITTPTVIKTDTTIRVAAEVTTKKGARYTLWAELDRQYESFVAKDTTALASPFVFPAARKDEDLVINGTVSEKWLSGVSEIINRIVGWNHGFAPIAVTANAVQTDQSTTQHRGVGVFFSGGVDSFSSYLRFANDPEYPITHLIFVHGFDIALDNLQLYTEVAETMQTISAETGLPCITVRTNVREVLDELLGWEMAHGGALAMVALLLRNGLSRIIIPGGGATDWQEPWGSSEYLDPRWSTESLEILHDEDGRMRFEKVRDYIAHSPLALKHLRVCWRNNGYNCCVCDKCMMTMAELRMAGVLQKAVTFPVELDLDRLSKLYTTPYSIQQFVEQAHQSLAETGADPELYQVLEHSLEVSKRPDFVRLLRTLIHDLDWKYNESRLFVFSQKLSRKLKHLKSEMRLPLFR